MSTKGGWLRPCFIRRSCSATGNRHPIVLFPWSVAPAACTLVAKCYFPRDSVLCPDEFSMASVQQKYDEAIKLQEAGKLEEAVGQLEALASEAPDYALAHAGLGAFYSKMDRHDEAVEHAQKVCELEPEDPFSFMAMSLICQKAGRLPEAEVALNQAMEKQWAAKKDG